MSRALVAACIAALSSAGLAGEVRYEAAVLDAALARRGNFVVAVVADWCSTCSRQAALVAELLEEPRFSQLVLIVGDFDSDVELKRRLKVVMQGTFVAFRDGEEVARSIGSTDKAAMAALFAKAQ